MLLITKLLDGEYKVKIDCQIFSPPHSLITRLLLAILFKVIDSSVFYI